jgi:hypothetical protein
VVDALFDPAAYGDDIARLLALDGNGARLMPLTMSGSISAAVLRQITDLRSSQGVRAGLCVYFGVFDEAHQIAQDLHTAEGSFWHAILHRREPDPGNAAYWFRQVGRHATFPALLHRAKAIAPQHAFGAAWDPFSFIEICEAARRDPGGDLDRIAREIQLAEWQLLFDYCARNNR